MEDDSGVFIFASWHADFSGLPYEKLSQDHTQLSENFHLNRALALGRKKRAYAANVQERCVLSNSGKSRI